MAFYDLIIESRNMFIGPEERSVAELFEFIGICDWNDDIPEIGPLAYNNAFIVEIISDGFRYDAQIDFNGYTIEPITGNVIRNETALTEDGAIVPKNRHNFQVIPQQGFYGSYFKYAINKTVPYNGFFNWSGCQMNAVPVNVDQEYFANFGTQTETSAG